MSDLKNWSNYVKDAMRNDPIKEHPSFIEVDLNKYQCPCCTSLFFKVGCDGGFGYVECLKPHCKHRDYIKNRMPRIPKVNNHKG